MSEIAPSARLMSASLPLYSRSSVSAKLVRALRQIFADRDLICQRGRQLCAIVRALRCSYFDDSRDVENGRVGGIGVGRGVSADTRGALRAWCPVQILRACLNRAWSWRSCDRREDPDGFRRGSACQRCKFVESFLMQESERPVTI